MFKKNIFIRACLPVVINYTIKFAKEGTPFFYILEVLKMNELEENVYKEIKNELIQSVIDKKIDTYFTNRNELTHYYNVGKMLVDAQGGEERAEFGNQLIKRYSARLTSELGKGYSWRNLYNMRMYYIFATNHEFLQPVAAKITWSHISILISLKNINEINYYTNQITTYHWSKRTLQEKIKNREYQRLDDKTKTKLINKEKLDIYDNIKNPIYINTYNSNIKDFSEKILKTFILRDMDNFLKQLGNGFCYIENEYKIQIGNIINYIDILLFNYIYNCFVVVELKVTKSKKDHLGQVMFYMNYIDKHIKTVNQEKTIGIIVCRKDDKYLIEYSSDDRIRITTYELV